MTSAAPLVLLPGLDGTGLQFDALLRVLPSDLRVTVVRYPDRADWDVVAYVAFIREQLPDVPCTVLAESFSTAVMLRLLRADPGPVTCFLAVNGFDTPPAPRLMRLAAALPGIGRAVRDLSGPGGRWLLGRDASTQARDTLRRALAEVPPAVIAARLRLLGGLQPVDGPPIDVACHALRGRQDRLVGPSGMRAYAQRFSTFTRTEINGPHLLLQTQPVEAVAWFTPLLSPRTVG